MAGQARRWAEAAAPPAARASGRGGGAEARAARSRRSAGAAGTGERWRPGAPGGWEWSLESEPKAWTPNLAEEWLAVLGTPGRDG